MALSHTVNTKPLTFDYEAVQVSPLKGRKYQVVKEIQFGNWTIKPGWCTNGANVPRAFWWLIEPNQSDILPAVICHDYLCDIADCTIIGEYVNFKVADRLFKEHLIYLGVAKWKRNLMFAAVRVFHWCKYERKWLNKRFKPRYLDS